MTDILKQRVVGLLLVVIAGVMFLPDILDGKKELTKEEFKKIPSRPEVNDKPNLTEFPTAEVIAKVKEKEPVTELEETSEKNETMEVNDKDLTEATNVIESDTTDVLAEIDTAENKTQVAESKKEEPKSVTQTTNIKPTFDSSAWVIQLGSFKHTENAEALMSKLKQSGFVTFSKPVETRAGILSKVFVGPELDKNKLQIKQNELKELTGLDGKLTPYDPIN